MVESASQADLTPGAIGVGGLRGDLEDRKELLPKLLDHDSQFPQLSNITETSHQDARMSSGSELSLFPHSA